MDERKAVTSRGRVSSEALESLAEIHMELLQLFCPWAILMQVHVQQRHSLHGLVYTCIPTTCT